MIVSLVALKLLMFSNPEIFLVNSFQESTKYEIFNRTSDRKYFFASLIDDVKKKVEEEQARSELVDDDIEEIIRRNRWEFILVIPIFIWIVYKSLTASK